jgi:hypothetical protein
LKNLEEIKRIGLDKGKVEGKTEIALKMKKMGESWKKSQNIPVYL